MKKTQAKTPRPKAAPKFKKAASISRRKKVAPVKSSAPVSTLAHFESETGLSLPFWLAIAFLNFLAQIIFRRELAPGAFGTLNTALAVAGLFLVPALALQQAFAQYLKRTHIPERRERLQLLRDAAPEVVQDFCWFGAIASFVLLPVLLPLLGLRHFSTCLLTILYVAVAIISVGSASICQAKNQLRFWFWLFASAAFIRVVLGAVLAWWEPSATGALGPTACIV